MVINTNLAALNASTALTGSSARLEKSLARLSSGSKIISASDDSAGLAVSSRANGQLSRLDGASSNINDALSFEQTQDGYLTTVTNALTRMGQLAMMAMDSTKSADERRDYDTEYQWLGGVLTDTGKKTFNGIPLFDNTALNVTVDADGNKFTMNGVSGDAFTLFAGHDSLLIPHDALAAIGYVNSALDAVAGYRAQIGANEETLGFYSNQIDTLKNNLSAANSSITDVDVAQESVNYARTNILVQSGTAMLAQANAQPQSVLKLLG